VNKYLSQDEKWYTNFRQFIFASLDEMGTNFWWKRA
jgi:hypothetical protein